MMSVIMKQVGRYLSMGYGIMRIHYHTQPSASFPIPLLLWLLSGRSRFLCQCRWCKLRYRAGAECNRLSYRWQYQRY